MEKEIYIDGISQIHFIAGMARLDMFTLEPVRDGEPKPVDAMRVIMTPQGFISALAAMQQLADKLIEAGVLQRTEK